MAGQRGGEASEPGPVPACREHDRRRREEFREGPTHPISRHPFRGACPRRSSALGSLQPAALSKVSGFGSFEPLPTAALKAGQSVPRLLRIDGIALPGQGYELRLPIGVASRAHRGQRWHQGLGAVAGRGRGSVPQPPPRQLRELPGHPAPDVTRRRLSSASDPDRPGRQPFGLVRACPDHHPTKVRLKTLPVGWTAWVTFARFRFAVGSFERTRDCQVRQARKRYHVRDFDRLDPWLPSMRSPEW